MNFFKKFNNLDLNKTEDKKFLISIGISFFGIILLLIGTSYAYLTFRNRGAINTLEAASVVLSLPAEGDSIVLTNALPSLDALALDENKAYTFTMKNSGTINNYYEIRLVNNCAVGKKINIGSEEIVTDLCIPNEYIKVAVKQGDEDYKVVSIGENGTIASGYISTTEQIDFKVKIWLSENTPNTYQSKVGNGAERNVVYYGKVQLYARQTNKNELTAEKSFAYTGSYQKYVVPYSGYYKIEVSGAQGGASSGVGGSGAKVAGVINLTVNDELYFYVGKKAGTFNGGGNSSNTNTIGGGATDVRYFGNYTPTTSDLTWNSTLGLNSRIIVAGGGGGVSSNTGGARGGNAWAYFSENGSPNTSAVPYTYVGYGATQTAGGSGGTTAGYAGGFGTGGTSAVYTDGHIGGGGGGGYYGGQGSKWHAGAGGGSSFISGVAGFNAITSSTSRTHTNNPLHYSGKYFIDEEFNLGSVTGAGSAKITYLGDTYQKTNAKLNNVRYIKDCINGNQTDSTNRWNEIQAIYKGNNVAKGKTAVTTDGGTLTNAAFVTDGDIGKANATDAYSSSQCILIDLGKTYNLDEVVVTHNWSYVSNNHYLYVSSDNANWKTLINNISSGEFSEGRRVTAYD